MSVFKGEAKLAFLGSHASGPVPSLGWCCGLRLLPGTAWLPSDWGGYSKARASVGCAVWRGCWDCSSFLLRSVSSGSLNVFFQGEAYRCSLKDVLSVKCVIIDCVGTTHLPLERLRLLETADQIELRK